MEIELIGALDYDKVSDVIGTYITDEDKIKDILSNIKNIEKARHSEIVATAGRLSRAKGDVLEVLKLSESKDIEKNANFINRVISMGHKSITDHDYLVFAIKDVSIIIEHLLISERYASFTIKSRREVDFRNSGYYIPNFHDNEGKLLEENEQVRNEYRLHMNKLFEKYGEYVDNGISTEDARFILPYCFYSNIQMGIDAHTLLDMIIKFTKTKYAYIDEVKEFGKKLYEIAKEYTPYLIPYIDAIPIPEENKDSVDVYLDDMIKKGNYKILDKVKLINSSTNIDETILVSSIMRRYQYNYDKARTIYKNVLSDEEIRRELMRKIAFESDREELHQVNFNFQIPVSYAILTHLQRHRTHHFLMSDFTNVDLLQYKKPPRLNKEEYDNIYKDNYEIYKKFKELGIRDEDLIYFTLAGNMTNIITNMDGYTIRHILELRECNKAQWETRGIAYGIHSEINKLDDATLFSSILGSTCVTQDYCGEGKESCGKIKTLKKI